ncbi:MAG: hypothetical protein ACLRMJ_10750 [Alistipes finegoldii]
MRFKRVALKNLAYQNKTLMLAVFALKEIGRPQVTEEHTAQLKTIFARFRSRAFCPICGWCRPGFVKSLCRSMKNNFGRFPTSRKVCSLHRRASVSGFLRRLSRRTGG